MRNRKAMLAAVLLIMPLLFSGILTQVPREITSSVTQNPTRIVMLSYVEHAPFVISNDTAMDDAAVDESWSGSGTELEPYVIEGYSITNDSNCFTIENVSRYFEIRDCFLDSETDPTGYGIFFQNVTNGLVVDTFVVNKNSGIWLYESPYNTIQNCTIMDCSANAITINLSNNTLVDESTLGDCGSGLSVISSNFTNVMRNEIYGGMGGVTAYYSRNCTFEANSIHNNRLGIQGHGINLYDTDNSSIVANEIYENQMHGIYNYLCQQNYIVENHIYNNTDHGIDMVSSQNITIIQNNIHDNGWLPTSPNAKCGIYLGSGIEYIQIEGNQIWNNTPTGITLGSAIYTSIVGNEIFSNTDFGILGQSAHNTSIVSNEIYGNGWDPSDMRPAGILTSGLDWWIEDNDIWNNTNHGILASSSNVTITGNTIWDCNEIGILIDEVSYNYIIENTIYNCPYGIYLELDHGNVTGNIIYDNEYGIFIDESWDCFIYDNDIGWNDENAIQWYDYGNTYWHDNVSLGNWWHDYPGSGNYGIYNQTGYLMLNDTFPQKNMYVNAATPDFQEISSENNEMVWNAFALNPLEFELFVNGSLYDTGTWDGGNLVFLVDGLSAGFHELELYVYHVSGHTFMADSSVTVTDLTNPSWIAEPSDQVINENEVLSVQFSAEDESGIGDWVVNDTINFHIDSTGLLTNVTSMTEGNYSLTISVEDIFGNILSSEIVIRVLYVAPTTTATNTTDTTTDPPPIFNETTMIVLLGGGGLGVIIILVIVMRKRGG